MAGTTNLSTFLHGFGQVFPSESQTDFLLASQTLFSFEVSTGGQYINRLKTHRHPNGELNKTTSMI